MKKCAGNQVFVIYFMLNYFFFVNAKSKTMQIWRRNFLTVTFSQPKIQHPILMPSWTLGFWFYSWVASFLILLCKHQKIRLILRRQENVMRLKLFLFCLRVSISYGLFFSFVTFLYCPVQKFRMQESKHHDKWSKVIYVDLLFPSVRPLHAARFR